MAKIDENLIRRNLLRTLQKKKYGRVRFSYSKMYNKRCRVVYISDRAYAHIVSEVSKHNPNETGGALLGHEKDGFFYIVESIDPGINTIHTVSHMETDKKYQNHLFDTLSRMYKCDLDLLGLWHRHPGNFNKFSNDDHETNDKYAVAIGDGTLSILVNLTPKLEFTGYFLDKTKHDVYYRVPILVGDKYFKDTKYLEYVSELEV